MTSGTVARRAVMVMALLALGAAVQVRAQSLGDVAREAEAKRKSTKTSGKVYTNDSLRPAPQPSSAPVAAAPAPAPSPSLSGVSPDEKAKEDEQKGEAYWRDRVKAERDALARAEAFAAALDSQINGLYGEFTACQAPPQCNEVAAKRRNAMAERDRVKKEVEDHTKAVTAIQEEARRAGVPAGWVR